VVATKLKKEVPACAWVVPLVAGGLLVQRCAKMMGLVGYLSCGGKRKIQNSLHGKGAQVCRCGLLLRHGPCNTVGAVTALELDWGQAGLQGELQRHSRCANPLLLSLSRQCQRWDSTSTSVHCCPHSRACAVSGLRSFLILVIWSCSQRSSVASLGTFPFPRKPVGSLGTFPGGHAMLEIVSHQAGSD
jgi:hypothetical protein